MTFCTYLFMTIYSNYILILWCLHCFNYNMSYNLFCNDYLRLLTCNCETSPNQTITTCLPFQISKRRKIVDLRCFNWMDGLQEVKGSEGPLNTRKIKCNARRYTVPWEIERRGWGSNHRCKGGNWRSHQEPLPCASRVERRAHAREGERPRTRHKPYNGFGEVCAVVKPDGGEARREWRTLTKNEKEKRRRRI